MLPQLATLWKRLCIKSSSRVLQLSLIGNNSGQKLEITYPVKVAPATATPSPSAPSSPATPYPAPPLVVAVVDPLCWCHIWTFAALRSKINAGIFYPFYMAAHTHTQLLHSHTHTHTQHAGPGSDTKKGKESKEKLLSSAISAFFIAQLSFFIYICMYISLSLSLVVD